MATTKKAAVKKVTEPKTALGKQLLANKMAAENRQAKAGYALSLVKAIGEDNRRLGQLEAGKKSGATLSQMHTVISNLDRANQLLLRWMRDYVEGK